MRMHIMPHKPTTMNDPLTLISIYSGFTLVYRLTAVRRCNDSTSEKINESPAVARVSRPYSWCTLATCVHNCPSMMFRTCCCLRPKCKRSYLLINITSEFRYKLNVRYLLEIHALRIAAKPLQIATWLLLTAYRNLPTPYPTVPSPTLYDIPFSHNTKRYRQTDDRRTEHRTISATVLPSTVG